jgi:hypothetical protein
MPCPSWRLSATTLFARYPQLPPHFRACGKQYRTDVDAREKGAKADRPSSCLSVSASARRGGGVWGSSVALVGSLLLGFKVAIFAPSHESTVRCAPWRLNLKNGQRFAPTGQSHSRHIRIFLNGASCPWAISLGPGVVNVTVLDQPGNTSWLGAPLSTQKLEMSDQEAAGGEWIGIGERKCVSSATG